MAIVDIDELLGEKEEQGFKVKGIDYAIPELSYNALIGVMELQTKINKAFKTGDAKTPAKLNMDMVAMVVPGLTAEYMRDKLSMRQMQHISRVVNKYLLEPGIEEGEPEGELNFYRKKYEDVYRKNADAVGEKAEEETPKK